MDTSQFIGFSDDGLYFTKKENLHAANPESMENLFANSLLLFILKKKSQLKKSKYLEKNMAMIFPHSSIQLLEILKAVVKLRSVQSKQLKNTTFDYIFQTKQLKQKRTYFEMIFHWKMKKQLLKGSCINFVTHTKTMSTQE